MKLRLFLSQEVDSWLEKFLLDFDLQLFRLLSES